MVDTRSIILLTGSKGSGKTRLLLRLMESLQKTDPEFDVRGLLSPSIQSEGRKVAIDLLDVATGERRELARTDKAASGPSTRHWHFHSEAIRWGNEVLAGAGNAELLLIDEMGPLEFERGEGFSAGMNLLDNGQFRVALVTVRPSLLSAANTRWHPTEVIDLASTPESEDQLEPLRRKLLANLETDEE